MQKSLVQTVFTAIQEGLQEDYQSFTSTRMLVTSNSKCALRWDIINTNLIELNYSQDIEIAIATMGFWKFPLLLDKENKKLYTLMNRKRYDDIVANLIENAPLYMQALVNLNADLGVLSPSLFSFDEPNEELHKVLNKLCNCFSNKNNFDGVHCNIITFSTDSYDNVIGLTLKTLDMNLQELDTSELLIDVTPVYSNMVEQVSEEDKNKPVLRLKKKAELRKGEENKVSLKTDDASNEKNA